MFTVPDWEPEVSLGKLHFEKAKKIKELPNINKSLEKIKKNHNDLRKIVNMNCKTSPKSSKKNNFKQKSKSSTDMTLKKVKTLTLTKKKNVHNKVTTNKIFTREKVDVNLKESQTPRKRKLEMSTSSTEKCIKSKPIKIKKEENFDTDKPDEQLLKQKIKVINDSLGRDDVEGLLFCDDKNKEESSDNKIMSQKKEKIKQILQLNVRNPIKTKGHNLRVRMLEKLKAAQFRYLNEKLYTSSGSEAQQLFQNDPTAFQTYHEGYQQQLRKWPLNPLDVIVQKISKMPKTVTIADMGCGQGSLSRRVPQRVWSFDLVSSGPDVVACDMARTPLPAASVHVAVYCLALMGTDLTRYLLEANRILKQGGILLVAEVESRFDNVDTFTNGVQKLGFKLTKLDRTHNVFVFLEFKKVSDPPSKRGKRPTLALKPCMYKKR